MSLSLKNKTVLITGASSGIGKATAYEFAKKGAKLILAARRDDRLKEISEDLEKTYQADIHPIKLDVKVNEQVIETLGNLPKNYLEIDILVNNAGLALDTLPLQEGNIAHWETMIDTNIKGLLYVTRAILPGMIKRNRGHIINVGSIAGHEYYPNGNVYIATKHAVKALNKSLRIDLLGKGIRVTEISPGAVHTEFSEVRWNDKERAKLFYEQFNPLLAEDIADSIIFCASRPAHVTIEEIIVMPTDQASANHIAKKS